MGALLVRATTYKIPMRNGSEIFYVVVMVCFYILVWHHSVSNSTVCKIFTVAVLGAVGNRPEDALDGGDDFEYIGLPEQS